MIAQIAKATLSEPIRSNGKIKMVPYGDEPVGGWSPVTSPDYDLTESDLLDPPRHRRKQPSGRNQPRHAQLLVARQGLQHGGRHARRPVGGYPVRRAAGDDRLAVHLQRDASIVCEFWRDRNLYIRNEWEIVVDERFCLIEAMVLLTITFGPQGLHRERARRRGGRRW